MKTDFVPTEEEAKDFKYTRGTIRRRIEPQPWRFSRGCWAWKRPESAREFDVLWVEGEADDMLDESCPLAKPRQQFATGPHGKKIKAESVRAENGPNGWEWVINWRSA